MSTAKQRYGADVALTPAVPYERVTIVFGAGVLQTGQPSPYLLRRVQTAVALYKVGKTSMLLMSADNRPTRHRQTDVMRATAMRLGVPAQAIITDNAGYTTHDTCVRARTVFGLHTALLVTQGYHLPRALTECRHDGVTGPGVAATHAGLGFHLADMIREVFATDKMTLRFL